MVNQLVLENFKHRPLRTALSALAIGISVMLVLTIQGLSEGMLEDSARRASGVGADIWLRPKTASLGVSSGSAPLNEKLVGFVRKLDHVRFATGSLVQPLQLPLAVQGIDLAELGQMSGGIRFLAGANFSQPDDIIVDEYYAQEKNLKVGSVISILNSKWRVCGIVESGKLSRLFVPLAVLQEKTSNVGRLTNIYIKLDDKTKVPAVMKTLVEKLPEVMVNSNDEVVSTFSANSIPQVKIFIRVVVGLAVFIGFVFVFLSMYTAVLERTREVGILKALGATPAYIAGILLREAVLLAVAGTVIGIGFSYLTRWIFLVTIPASMQQKIVPEWWPTAAVIALSGAILGTAYPGMKAAKQDTIEALAYD